ncbi:MAG: SUMF1/EgtB/PvdO family nonheme iron enzyme [Thermoguttaceae bacterium]|nr:SUMF1/EgtB/PvdO family nonheme iron enzyme [Thermoguttaceae bacterium]
MSILQRIFCLISVITSTTLAFIASSYAAAPSRTALLLDEIPGAPMRVEADIFAQLALEIDDSIVLLAPTEQGVVKRDGTPVEPGDYDRLWIFQGDEIVQTSPLYSPAVLDWLRRFDGALLLAGGAAALAKPLGLDPELEHTPVTFGEDRAQAGLAPFNMKANVFAGVETAQIWITNAAFPAFETFHAHSPTLISLAKSTKANAGDYLCAAIDPDSRRIRAFLFPWRVSPLYDAAAVEFRRNFTQLVFNMATLLGSELAEDAAVPPAYVAPNFDALQRALDWFNENYDFDEYPNGMWYSTRLSELRTRSDNLARSAEQSGPGPGVDAQAAELLAEFAKLQREALLDNPEIDFDSFLYIRRNPEQLGLPENYNSNSVIPKTGYNDELRRFNFRTGESTLVYKSPNGEFVGDLELYYDASKVMFSSPDPAADNRWRIWELPLAENPEEQQKLTPRVMPLVNDPDVDNYDGCYLPDDRVIFCSTASMSGVPCINGSGHVCNLYSKELDGSIRQLTLEQDHDWNPVVLNNGRVMYLRWEYVDLPHAFSRIMFHMNPDGTNQSELYGSGSYWPNSVFYPRPLPGDPSKFVGVVTGHHELNRQGELVIFDPSKGRKEASGVVQRIPGYGKEVSPIACDLPIEQSWPKFLHPYPITDNVFLVSCKRSPSDGWNICLVDVFDNITPLLVEPDATLEPIPLRETERQPILPDRVNMESPTADFFIADVYEGPGLQGVPRGEVKSIRVFSYEFAYQGMGAEPYSVGLDGPWDPRRIIGTVPVNEDGSAFFKAPAYTPISLQPLDKDGRALQIMRSWITALPGETVSCVGCHEPQDSTSPTNPRSLASQSAPVELTPFYGPTRGFSFEREIQPILDKYCVECHQPDSEKVKMLVADGKVDDGVWEKSKRPGETYEYGRLPDLRKAPAKPTLEKGNYIAAKSPVSNAYYQLRRFVYTPTKESQMSTHLPCEFSADMQPLVTILAAGHFGVELDPQSWEKLYAWIDLNAPYFGNWGEMLRKDNPALVDQQWNRREELRKLYAPSALQLDDDPNAPVAGEPLDDPTRVVRFSTKREPCEPVSWTPADTPPEHESVALNDSIALDLVAIPGTNLSVGVTEITNAQYRAFDPEFNAGIEYADFIQFSPGERGWLLSRDRQPAARVSWNDAQKYCAWLSEKTGDEYRLPTLEEQRALVGAGEHEFWFGAADSDYSAFENLADSTYAKISPFGWTGRVETLPAWRPVDWNVDDHSRVSAPVASYLPNRFGLYDVQGNVSEWTSSELTETRDVVDLKSGEIVDQTVRVKKLAGGGSWTTPSKKAFVGSARAYPDYFKMRDVGFRVVKVRKSAAK